MVVCDRFLWLGGLHSATEFVCEANETVMKNDDEFENNIAIRNDKVHR